MIFSREYSTWETPKNKNNRFGKSFGKGARGNKELFLKLNDFYDIFIII